MKVNGVRLPNGLVRMCYSKNAYSTEPRAQVAALKSCLKFDKPMRVYKCPYCARFHLTSKVVSLI